MNSTIVFFCLLIAIIVGANYLYAYRIISLPASIGRFIAKLTFILLVYLGAAIAVRLSHSQVLKRFDDSVEIEQQILAAKLYVGFVYILATAIVLWQLGITAQNIFIFFGLMATGFAFAIRDVLLSYLVWFVLLTKRPFRIGDYIRIGEDEGVVKHIGTFFVLLDDSPGTHEDCIRIPNKIFMEKTVHNLGREMIKFYLQVPISKIPSQHKILELTKQLQAETKGMAEARLDINGDKWVIKASYFSVPEARKQMHDLVIGRIARLK